MILTKNIILVGMPGAGKTTLGKRIAKSLGLKFVDLDHEIELYAQQSIEQIFEEKGEDYFRDLERKVLTYQLNNQNIVLSTGGGAPCFFDNMQLINNSGISIFLNVSVQELQTRLLFAKANDRPMTKGKTQDELKNFIEQKLQQRLKYYKQSMIVIESDKIVENDLMQRISTFQKPKNN